MGIQLPRVRATPHGEKDDLGREPKSPRMTNWLVDRSGELAALQLGSIVRPEPGHESDRRLGRVALNATVPFKPAPPGPVTGRR